MKRILYAGTVLLALSVLSACSNYNYYTAARNKTNLSSYHTFAWMPSAPGKHTQTANDASVKDAVTAALVQKGLRLDPHQPDLVVSYTATVGQGTKSVYYSPYYSTYGYPGWGWNFGWGPAWGFGWGWGYYRPYYYAWGAPFHYYGDDIYAGKERYKEGTLIIDLIDTRTRKIVWRGFGVGDAHKPDKTLKDTPKVVDGIISQLQITPSAPNSRSI